MNGKKNPLRRKMGRAGTGRSSWSTPSSPGYSTGHSTQVRAHKTNKQWLWKRKKLKSQMKNVLRWNSWTEFFFEVSRHKLSLLRLEFLSGFQPSYFLSAKCLAQIDSSFLVSRIFCTYFLNQSLVFFKNPPVEKLWRAWSKRLKLLS